MCHSVRCERKHEILGPPGHRRCSLKAFALSAALLLTPALFAQNAKPDDPKVRSQPCVIAKRHVHKFGENMSRLHPHRPFDYVEGDYPTGFKWRSELSDGFQPLT
jgi:hypothetical protein